MFNGHIPRVDDPWKLGRPFTRRNLVDMIEHPLAFVGGGQCVKTGGLTATLVDADGNHEPGRVLLVGEPMVRAILAYLESLPEET